MKTYKEKYLKKHISEKGIIITPRGKKLFNQYDYYQVINGYKYLFIDSIENIDDIKRKINSTVHSHEVFYANFLASKDILLNQNYMQRFAIRFVKNTELI